MGILEKIKSLLVPPAPKTSMFFGIEGAIAPTVTDASLPQSFVQCDWVRTAVSRIASATASVPWLVKVKKGNDWTDAPSHNLAVLLDYVNERDDAYILKEFITSWLILDGNAYIYKARPSPNQPPEALIPLPSDLIRIEKPKNDNWRPSGYIYTPQSSKKVHYPAEDIIHIRTFSTDWWYGQGDIKALENVINQLLELDYFNLGFLKRGAIPAGILKATDPEGLTEAQKARLRQYWQGQIEKEKWGVPPLVGPDFEFQATGVTIDRVLAKEMPDKLRERILSALGLPPAVGGIFEYANYANVVEQNQMLWSVRIIPLTARILAAFNEQLAPEFGKDVQIFPDEDFFAEKLNRAEERFARAQGALRGVPFISINEGREIVGLPPVEGGDVILVPMSLIPLQQFIELTTEKAPQSEQQKRGLPSGPPLKELHVKAHSRRLSPEGRVLLWRRFNAVREHETRRLGLHLNKWLDNLAQETIEKLEHSASRPTASRVKTLWLDALIFNAVEAMAALEDIVTPILSELYARTGQESLATIDASITFELSNPRWSEWLKTMRDVHMRSIVDTAQEQVRATLAAGIAAGETVEDLKMRVARWAEEGKKKYIPTVARTEVGSAMNGAAHEAYLQAGAPYKEWISIVDERSREDHAALDGTIIPISENFELDSGSYSGPYDPAMGPEDVCNCRCTLGAVMD